MKQRPLITLLLVMVCGLAVMALLLVIRMQKLHRTARKMQPIIGNNQLIQSQIQSLALEVLEYSKHNPSIDPILTAVGVKQGQPAPPTAPVPAPPAKLPGK